MWLGWLVGVPLLFWTASGLWMVARPIEEVRGTAVRAGPAPLSLPATIVPPAANKTLSIEMQRGRATWIVDGERRADAVTGRVLPGPTRAEAIATARAAYAVASPVAGVSRTPADAPPLDLRRARPAWGVAFADGTHVYVDAGTGSVLALRTRQWRAFDWMWGLHIMDLQGREDTSHLILIGAAALAMVATLLALVLLPMMGRRRR